MGAGEVELTDCRSYSLVVKRFLVEETVKGKTWGLIMKEEEDRKEGRELKKEQSEDYCSICCRIADRGV